MPTLTPQNVEVRFGKADTKASTKLSIPGTLDVAQNVVMNESGRYDRRAGTSVLTTLAGTRNIHDHRDELLLGTADALYSRFGGADNNRGSLTSFDTRHEPVNNTAFEQRDHDMVRYSGRDYHVWEDARGGIRYAVRDNATGAYVVSEGLLANEPLFLTQPLYAPRIFALSSGCVFVAYAHNDPNSNNVRLCGRKIEIATPSTVGAEVVIDADFHQLVASDETPSSGYDGIVISSTEITFVYLAKNGGNTSDERTRVQKWDVAGGVSVNTVTEAADTGAGKSYYAFLRFDASAGYHISQASGNPLNKVRLLTVPTNFASITAVDVKAYGGATFLRATTGWVDGSSTCHFLVESRVTSGTGTRPVVYYYTRTSGGVVTTVATRYGFALASQAFTSGADKFVFVTVPIPGTVASTASMFLANATTGALVGRVLSARAAVDDTADVGYPHRGLPAVQTTAAGFVVAADYRISTTQIGAAVAHADPSARQKWVEATGVTVIPGSWPRIYDGLGVTELGFEGPPNVVDISQSGSLGVANGLYYYRLTWFWIDATGAEHESEPSPAEAFTVTGGPRGVLVSFETLTATLKQSPSQGAVARIWRTEANPSSSSGAAFFLSGIAETFTTSPTHGYTDLIADAVLVTQQRLYTLGDTVLASTRSSPCTAMAAWGGRLWSADGDALIYSKLLEDDRGIAHSDVNFETVADSYGDFVALADGGSRLLAFKRAAIYSRSGQGPNNLGVGEFPPIDRLELPLGARSQQSVVSTEIGVFFQDHLSGQIWLIGDNGAEYIGAPVEGVLGGTTIVDAVQVGRQVRFYSAGGTTYVFDLHHKIWTWLTGQAAVGAGAINGVAHYVTSGGIVRYDDAAVWTEGGTAYQAVLETGWLSFAGLAGHQRTYRVHALGENLGAHTVAFKPYYRFGTSTETKSLASSAVLAGHGYRVEFRPSLTYQCSTAIKVRIEDNSPSTAGWGLEALILEVGIDRKAARLPSAHRAA